MHRFKGKAANDYRYQRPKRLQTKCMKLDKELEECRYLKWGVGRERKEIKSSILNVKRIKRFSVIK